MAPTDLFANVAPARKLQNPANCSVGRHEQFCDVDREADCLPYPGFPGALRADCSFEDDLFTESVLDFIDQHSACEGLRGNACKRTGSPPPPFFLFWAPHIAHAPLQVPPAFLERFRGIDDWRRRRYAAMVHYLDASVGRVVDRLRTVGLWDSTLMVFSSDNGGSVVSNGGAGGNNWPLKGGKMSNWEGGVRVPAFASGGWIPPHRRGRRLEGLVTLWDWHATFAALSGASAVDPRAAAAGLPPPEGHNVWPYLSGAVTRSPRSSVVLGSSVLANGTLDEYGEGDAAGNGTHSYTIVGGMIVDEGKDGLWKLLYEDVLMSGWQGPRFPNLTVTTFFQGSVSHCGSPARGGSGGCLYRLDEDPTEHADVAALYPERVAAMLATLSKHNATVFSPYRGPWDPKVCVAAIGRWGGFWGPWLE